MISPDDYISEYGSDVFRMYLAFGFAYTEGGPWSDEGLKAISRFVGRVERLVEGAAILAKAGNAGDAGRESSKPYGSAEKELNYVRNMAIKCVGEDAGRFQFNTSIARLMELVNALYKYESIAEKNMDLYLGCINDLLIMLSPFAPHLAEELWERLGKPYSIFNAGWPAWDEKALVRDEVEIAIQINGRIKERIMMTSGLDGKQTKKRQ